MPACTAVLGLDEEGVPVLLRLPSADVAHVLIAGTTGGQDGAGADHRALAGHAQPPARVQLVLIDPKRRGFLPFAALPHLLTPVMTRVERRWRCWSGWWARWSGATRRGVEAAARGVDRRAGGPDQVGGRAMERR